MIKFTFYNKIVKRKPQPFDKVFSKEKTLSSNPFKNRQTLRENGVFVFLYYINLSLNAANCSKVNASLRTVSLSPNSLRAFAIFSLPIPRVFETVLQRVFLRCAKQALIREKKNSSFFTLAGGFSSTSSLITAESTLGGGIKESLPTSKRSCAFA